VKITQLPYINQLHASLSRLRYFLPLRKRINGLDLFLLWRLPKSTSSDPTLISIHLRKPTKRVVFIRKFSLIDKEVFRYVFFNEYHNPPITLKENCVILDLGANIGLTMVDFKQKYPKSKIWGFEMDTENYLLAQKNIIGLPDCSLENIAVWDRTKTVRYATNVDEDAYNISEPLDTEGGAYKEIEALSMDDILIKFDLKTVDYVKMDIEGAEKEVLRHDERAWLKQVNCLNIEIHDPSFLEEAMQILKEFGFDCQKDTNHWSAILAIRRA
jgi:FkbM family methyltransferase